MDEHPAIRSNHFIFPFCFPPHPAAHISGTPPSRLHLGSFEEQIPHLKDVFCYEVQAFAPLLYRRKTAPPLVLLFSNFEKMIHSFGCLKRFCGEVSCSFRLGNTFRLPRSCLRNPACPFQPDPI